MLEAAFINLVRRQSGRSIADQDIGTQGRRWGFLSNDGLELDDNQNLGSVSRI